MNVRPTSILSLIIVFAVSLTVVQAGDRVKPGIDVLREDGFDILHGKRIGLVTNPTGISAEMESTIDILFNAEGVKLAALFGPEHGVRGDVDAGKYVDSFNDQRTGIRVYSLYGKTRKPTKEMLRGIDVMVYDIQDIGVRSYTFISTMALVMEAAAESGIPVVVLDRPNPLTGDRVEGPMLEAKYKSFVGAFTVPYVYGMTAGELARMINAEGWLANGIACSLTVVPMKGWKRSMWWDETGLAWVPTSPHIPQWHTTMFYVMTGLLGELGTANQGVGYTLPFELVGAPWVSGQALARYLNTRGLSGVKFRPMWYQPFYRDTSGIRYEGVQIHITDRSTLNMTAVQVYILEALYRVFPEKNIFLRAKSNRLQTFDKVVGSPELRHDLMNSTTVQEILGKFDRLSEQFKQNRKKYLLYD